MYVVIYSGKSGDDHSRRVFPLNAGLSPSPASTTGVLATPGRIPREDKGFIETGDRISSLRPSTAYLMLCLAKPAAGDIIVDW